MADPVKFETTMKLVFMDLIKPSTDDFGRSTWGVDPIGGQPRIVISESLQPAENDLMNTIRSIFNPLPYGWH